MVMIDDTPENRDWIKQGSPDFLTTIESVEGLRAWIESAGMTVESFKQTVAYKSNVETSALLQLL
jgi:hypothetical protein